MHCNSLILCLLSLLSLFYLQANLDSLVVENENSTGEVQVKKNEMILVLLAAAVHSVLPKRQECTETAITLEKNAGCFCCLRVEELAFFSALRNWWKLWDIIRDISLFLLTFCIP